MEFKKFVNAFIRMPVQLIREARRLTFRLLSWNPWQAVFLRGVDALRRSAAVEVLRSMRRSAVLAETRRNDRETCRRDAVNRQHRLRHADGPPSAAVLTKHDDTGVRTLRLTAAPKYSAPQMEYGIDNRLI